MRRLSLIIFLGVALFCFAGTAIGDDVYIFTANWCGPCRELKRALNDNPTALARHNVTMIDIEQSKELVTLYGVKTVPTILHFTEDQKIRRYSGFKGLPQLETWLDSNQTGIVRRLLRR